MRPFSRRRATGSIGISSIILRSEWKAAHTGGMEVAGPGSVSRVGNGVSAQACSTSALERPAGKVATLLFGAGTANRSVNFQSGSYLKEPSSPGITSEQSTRLRMLCPRIDILSIAAANFLRILFWSRTKLCHSQAVRESRASSPSD